MQKIRLRLSIFLSIKSKELTLLNFSNELATCRITWSIVHFYINVSNIQFVIIFTHKNSKIKYIFRLKLGWLFTVSYKGTKCLSYECRSGWWLKEKLEDRFINSYHISMMCNGRMKKLYESVSHAYSLQWLNWLLNPEPSWINFWNMQKTFGQTDIWENWSHPSRNRSLNMSPERATHCKPQKIQIIAELIWSLLTPHVPKKTMEGCPCGIGCTPWTNN